MTEFLDLAVADLARSGLTADDAEAAGIFVTDDASTLHKGLRPAPATVIPYRDIDGRPLPTKAGDMYRVRYLTEPPAKGFIKNKARKYDQPPETGVQIYFPPFDWRAVLDDPSEPVLIVEGEKKALRAVKAGFACIGVGGVYNFMNGPDLHPDLARFATGKRTFYVCYDSDAVLNAQIQIAEARLTQELGIRLKCDVRIIRLPTIEGQEKTGIDDFLEAKGEDAFMKLAENAISFRHNDAAVLALNAQVAWISKHGMIYEFATGNWIQKHNFITGEQYSTISLTVPNAKGDGVKKVKATEVWLTHPMAARFSDVVFDPSTEGQIVRTEGGSAINTWKGFEPEFGDVEVFLEFTDYLFSSLGKDKDLPLKLLAFKAQNPARKIPLAIVLVGEQGCGKSTWAKIIGETFAPYTQEPGSSTLLSEFNGWVENCLIAVMDEAQSAQVRKGEDVLKSLISEATLLVNQKYQVARRAKNYATFILTSNDRAVGGYAYDDRRMIVVSCPLKGPDQLYRRLHDWLVSNGPKRLLGWLLSYDLGDWQPPSMPPLTAEKIMSYEESLTPAQRLAKDMRTANSHVILAYCASALEWARKFELDQRPGLAARARDVALMIPRMPLRCFYTPEELMMLFPDIAETLYNDSARGQTSTGAFSRQLRNAGVPYLVNKDDPRGFTWQGATKQYLIVADQSDWREPITQADFERAMKNSPTYEQYCRQQVDSGTKRAMKKPTKEAAE